MAKRGRPKKDTQKAEWRRMLEADPLVQDLIKKHHRHLERAKIVILGKPKAGKRHGKLVYAVAKRVTEATQTLVKETGGEEIHYEIQVGLDQWDHLDTKTRKIVLDQALCHFTGLDLDKNRWGMRGPDVEEFNSILERHGAWNVDLQLFCRVAKQMPLDLE